MTFTFTVTVEVERTQGKFATREELAEQLREAIEGADPGQLEGDNGGEYEVSSFEVEETETPKPERRRKVSGITPLAPVAAPARYGLHTPSCPPDCQRHYTLDEARVKFGKPRPEVQG